MEKFEGLCPSVRKYYSWVQNFIIKWKVKILRIIIPWSILMKTYSNVHEYSCIYIKNDLENNNIYFPKNKHWRV